MIFNLYWNCWIILITIDLVWFGITKKTVLILDYVQGTFAGTRYLKKYGLGGRGVGQISRAEAVGHGQLEEQRCGIQEAGSVTQYIPHQTLQ
jgi:hypothetical protein